MGFVRYPDREARDRRIRELRAQGLSLRAIAAIVGCHHITVWEACDSAVKARSNTRRAAYNSSAAGLERQRQYRLRKGQTPPARPAE